MAPEEWRLLHRIVVVGKSVNPKVDRAFRVEGDPVTSQRFDPLNQVDFAPTLKSLRFDGGRSLLASGRSIGNAIQAIRKLSNADERMLSAYSKGLRRHSTDAGYEDAFRPLIEEEVTPGRTLSGAGFGDPETNRLVEAAAIEFVRSDYESTGWTVRSVEAEKCGYDLECRKDKKSLHIEVKGVRGKIVSFIITAGENKKALTDPDFLLCVVTSALEKKPQIQQYTGVQLKSRFRFDPLAYKVTLTNT